MGVYDNCKAKILKNKNTEQQEEPAAQIKPTSEISETNSSVSAKEDLKHGGPTQIFQFHGLAAASSSGMDNSEILDTNSSLIAKEASKNGESVQTFKVLELVAATRNFGADCSLGGGGFGRVYKGRLASTNQVVSIKKLVCNEWKGDGEFLDEESRFGMLHHPHFVNLVGYCRHNREGFLVYEYMPLGSLDDHLHGLLCDEKPLDWSTRMKIAAGVAKGLEYLHDKVNPPVVYGNLKRSNIMLGEGYHPKLSDFGRAEFESVMNDADKYNEPMFPRINEYRDPAITITGGQTVKSDVYSFGVLLLEIITGRNTRTFNRDRGDLLLTWFRKNQQSGPFQIVDPRLHGQYPPRGLERALAVAELCVQYNPHERTSMAPVAEVLNEIASQKYDPENIQ